MLREKIILKTIVIGSLILAIIAFITTDNYSLEDFSYPYFLFFTITALLSICGLLTIKFINK